ncbi:MAG: hypothetical protein DRI46_14065 [Chloroflexi bacterium]|nr:MAG: hypothetical protein DRI46_14065 [Chloroflexota bacterium]
MKETMLAIILLSLFLISPLEAKDVQSIENNNLDATLSVLKEKNIRLEEQNKILIHTSTELRNSYYWALGFSATFLLLFLGVNIYFFRNRYNEDKEYLLKHVDSKLHEGANEMRNYVSKQLHNLESRLEKVSVKAVKQSINDINAKINNLHSIIGMNKIDIIELEIEQTKLSGVQANVLRSYVDIIQELRKLDNCGWDWKISDYLSEVCELLKEGVKFNSSELPEVSSLLNGLPNQFDDIVYKIRNHMR